ncbi:hypothetical protein [Lacihabitans soyangensis]|uniref:Uncharacterized protein n=1 Tax=Lacihabitans soyangensis TaxID=869394 RepID=A0AAE3H4U9_9BACT|nr:hypothetical protein [Lacihabitans soyangensis]MCP9764942.1 hypothetical protein [Lacihabitans soyangensis]
MIGAEIKDVRGYFEDWVEASADVHGFLYGEIRHKLDVVNSTVKRYPVMVMDQPNVKTTIRGGVYFNTYNMGISIVEKVKDGSLKAHAGASDRTFTILGKLIKQLIADQRQYTITHSPLVFENDEVDTNLVADHVGWRTEFQLMIACGDWVR